MEILINAWCTLHKEARVVFVGASIIYTAAEILEKQIFNQLSGYIHDLNISFPSALIKHGSF